MEVATRQAWRQGAEKSHLEVVLEEAKESPLRVRNRKLSSLPGLLTPCVTPLLPSPTATALEATEPSGAGSALLHPDSRPQPPFPAQLMTDILSPPEKEAWGALRSPPAAAAPTGRRNECQGNMHSPPQAQCTNTACSPPPALSSLLSISEFLFRPHHSTWECLRPFLVLQVPKPTFLPAPAKKPGSTLLLFLIIHYLHLVFAQALPY